MSLYLTDTHCHLNLLDPSLLAEGEQTLLDHTLREGVGRIVCIGVDRDTQSEVLGWAERHAQVFATVGVHPNHVSEAEDWVWLKEVADHPKVVAIGETGLDYHYGAEHAVLQQESFRRHIDLAKELNLPLVVHTREARADTLALLAHAGRRGGVMHCFTEDWDTARKAMDMGFYISFSGVVSFRNADNLRDVLRRVPEDRILLETDAPWLAPVPHRSKPNRPAWVRHVAEVVATVRSLPIDRVAAITSENAERLFGFSTLCNLGAESVGSDQFAAE